jgi:hypothetical protein
MKKLSIPILFTLLFLITFFLPVLHFSFGKDLNGFEAFIFNFTRLFLVQNYIEYLKVVSTVLTSFFVLVMLIWSYRKQVKLIPVVMVGLIALITGLSWAAKYGGQGVLMFGYWVWIGYILLLIGYLLLKIRKPLSE